VRSAHGVPSPAQMPGDGPDPVPFSQQLVHHRVVPPGSLGELPAGSGSRCGRGTGAGCAGGPGSGPSCGPGLRFGRAGAVRGDAPSGRLGGVLPQVETRVGGTGQRPGSRPAPPVRAPSNGAGAVPADHFHAGMGGQPVREGCRVAAVQQAGRGAGLAADQHRAVVLAAPDREIHPEHPRSRRCRVRDGHHQP
jgi:hypothetical protein